MKQIRSRAILLALILSCVLTCMIPAVSAAKVVDEPEKTPFNAATLTLYTHLRTALEEVSNGSRADAHIVIGQETFAEMGLKTEWTATELGVESIGENESKLISEQFMAQFEGFSHLLEALMHDMPGELYWFDKTEGFQRGLSSRQWGDGIRVDRVEITEFHAYFLVSPAYQGEGYSVKTPTVDPSAVARANAAMEAANAIVTRYADLPDYQKLLAYRDEICALVSYNDAAVAPEYTGGYGDPWQMIYVFDGDPDTNVVCEGYAKAFAYLCSKSSFAADVECYTVTGQMQGGTGAGGHMWNIVSINGKSYIADITNSDEGTAGQAGELFLTGYDRQTPNAYVFNAGNSEISYWYYSDTVALLEGYGVLLLESNDYTPPSFEIVLPDDELTYTGGPITVGNVDSHNHIIYRTDALPDGNYQWTVEWYQNGEELSYNPILPGTYLLRVTATDLQDPRLTYTEEREVTIGRATPKYTLPTGLTATYGDLLSEVILPTGFAWESSDESKTVGIVGTRSFTAVYTPEDTTLYLPVTLQIPVTVSPLDISEAEITLAPSPTYTGAVLAPEITSATLKGMDITYNLSVENAVEPGEYTLMLTGTGNYCGTVIKEWRILPGGGNTTNTTPDSNGGSGTGNGSNANPDNGKNNGENDNDTVLILAIAAGVGIPLFAVIIIATGKKKK